MEWNERVKIIADFDIFFTLKNPFYWADVFLHDSGLSTHWGRVTHIYASVNELVMIGSDNVLSPGRRQAFIWNNVGILLTEPLGTNFSENFIEIYSFSIRKMHLKISPEKKSAILSGPRCVYSASIIQRQQNKHHLSISFHVCAGRFTPNVINYA